MAREGVGQFGGRRSAERGPGAEPWRRAIRVSVKAHDSIKVPLFMLPSISNDEIAYLRRFNRRGMLIGSNARGEIPGVRRAGETHLVLSAS